MCQPFCLVTPQSLGSILSCCQRSLPSAAIRTFPKLVVSLYSIYACKKLLESNGFELFDNCVAFQTKLHCMLTHCLYASCAIQHTVHTCSQVATFVAGFSNAMAQALEGRDYGTYGYSCAGAIGYGSKGSWTSAFNQVNT